MDLAYMQRALELARRGAGGTSPNPLVGAVVVQRGKIVGTGYHRKCGEPHAEIIALDRAGLLARGADLYVNLEPCNHWGRTPPCTDAIIKAGIVRVFSAVRDPNPLMRGRGIARLRSSGIEVYEGLLAEEAFKTNEIFFTYMLTKRPFVALKLGAAPVEPITTHGREYRWIREDEVLPYERTLRRRYDALLMDTEAAKKNGVLSTDRPGGKNRRNPIPLIVNSPPSSDCIGGLFVVDGTERIMIATANRARVSRLRSLRRKAEVLVINRGFQVDLSLLLKRLGEREITSILVEGGSMMHRSFLSADLADKYYCIAAAPVYGGDGASAFSYLDRASLSDWAYGPVEVSGKYPGERLLETGYLHEHFYQPFIDDQVNPATR
jgi:diaminohydroxyphosphoribosylaminopyrimidine deaminase/5-amino-6-(5-phosphoribosylamino)uracil reductase